jgi:hypothetical protein
MENFLQQFEGTSLIKRDSIEIELVFDLIKFTILQNIFSDTCVCFEFAVQQHGFCSGHCELFPANLARSLVNYHVYGTVAYLIK